MVGGGCDLALVAKLRRALRGRVDEGRARAAEQSRHGDDGPFKADGGPLGRRPARGRIGRGGGI